MNFVLEIFQKIMQKVVYFVYLFVIFDFVLNFLNVFIQSSVYYCYYNLNDKCYKCKVVEFSYYRVCYY